MGLNQLGWGASAVTGAVVALGRLLDNQRSSNWAEFHPGIQRRGADILNIVPDNAGAACTVFPAVFVLGRVSAECVKPFCKSDSEEATGPARSGPPRPLVVTGIQPITQFHPFLVN
jgi:hypothetical protein